MPGTPNSLPGKKSSTRYRTWRVPHRRWYHAICWNGSRRKLHLCTDKYCQVVLTAIRAVIIPWDYCWLVPNCVMNLPRTLSTLKSPPKCKAANCISLHRARAVDQHGIVDRVIERVIIIKIDKNGRCEIFYLIEHWRVPTIGPILPSLINPLKRSLSLLCAKVHCTRNINASVWQILFFILIRMQI